MPLSVLKKVILCLFVLRDSKSYAIGLCYWCLEYITDIMNSYWMCTNWRWWWRTLYHWFCKKNIWTSPNIWAYMFIQEHYDLGKHLSFNKWEDIEKILNNCLRIKWMYVLCCYLLYSLCFYFKSQCYLFLHFLLFLVY